MSNLILDETYYSPVFFRDNPRSDNPERCTLLIRRYRVRQGSKRPWLNIKSDAKVWSNEDAMGADLLQLDWKELPEEADGNPRYVPDEVASALAVQ